MRTKLALTCAAVVALASLSAAPAGAQSHDPVPQTPPKDCTRLNGRFGYYGNPWCTPVEQRLWDRWIATHPHQ